MMQNVHACACYVTRYASEAAAGSMTKLALHGKPYRFCSRALLWQPFAPNQLHWSSTRRAYKLTSLVSSCTALTLQCVLMI